VFRPSDILAFWREAGRDRWYEKDAAFDDEVRRRCRRGRRATTAHWR
jgi:uncharacterized protein (DUF924 family)